MNSDLEHDYWIHCGQIGVTIETIQCPRTRCTFDLDRGDLGDRTGFHIIRHVSAPPVEPSAAEDGPLAA